MVIPDQEDIDYQLLIDVIKARYGYDFSQYSQASMIRRIEKFLVKKGIQNFTFLTTELQNKPLLFQEFVEEITVNVTEMFRDPEFFRSLRKNIVPYLRTYPNLRVWDAGCSTGEETYSLAIILKEENLLPKTRIYATDINKKVLAVGREGIYPISYLKNYSKNYINSGGIHSLSDYYHAKFNQVIMDQAFANHILFTMHNLVSDGSFNQFNMIVCRNVLIYFKKELQEHVLKLFLDSLPLFGFLALGSKESIKFSAVEKNFKVIDQKEKIFQRIK